MSARRLRVLIQKLPSESHTLTALRNELSDEELAAEAEKAKPEQGRWSQVEHLLAAHLDLLRRIEWVLLCTNVEKKDQPPAPEPVRRPGVTAKPPKKALTEARAQTLLELINGGAS